MLAEEQNLSVSDPFITVPVPALLGCQPVQPRPYGVATIS